MFVILVLYLIVVFLILNDKSSETIWEDNIKRELTAKDVWLSLIWPVFWLLTMCKVTIWLINDTLVIILLLVGFKYKRTNMYRWIDEKMKF